MKNWFEINRAGLAKILQRKGKEFAIFELIQNAWDEDGVTEVIVKLVPDGTPGYACLVVIDDAPNGFDDLTHAYTLFAESRKKADPEKRGRFNIGEKLVLALAREAKIVTTTGTVTFNKNGRRRSATAMAAGSMVEMVIKMTKDEVDTAVQACQKLIPPKGILTTVNQTTLITTPPKAQFDAALLTEVADQEGYLVRSTRRTAVQVYPANDSCPAAIYEMGIPVCEIDGKYIFNVCQKVPLTMDREEVLPQFRKQLAVAALNNLRDTLDTEDANTAWAAEAITSPDVEPDAVKAYLTQRFGEKRVIYDPSDPEANSLATSQGYTVITGGALSRAAWDNVRSSSAALPAGQVTPSPKPYSESGKPLNLVPPDAGMSEVAAYAGRFARIVLGTEITVRFAAEVTWPYAATYGPGDLTFNMGRLGRAWFNLKDNRQEIDELLIHEFGHHFSIDHLSSEYHEALCRIGARLAAATRTGKL